MSTRTDLPGKPAGGTLVARVSTTLRQKILDGTYRPGDKLPSEARLTAEHVARYHPDIHFWCPQLPPSPREAMTLVMQGLATWPRKKGQGAMAVMGSSLGGFYASWVAQQMRCPSVLLNPAVEPERDLARHIGRHTAWHNPQEHFDFLPDYLAQLHALDVRALPPAGAQLLIAAQGDEVLDWREMVARYPQATQRIVPGGNHALSEYPLHLQEVMRFCCATA